MFQGLQKWPSMTNLYWATGSDLERAAGVLGTASNHNCSCATSKVLEYHIARTNRGPKISLL